jgi:hypothetical protein
MNRDEERVSLVLDKSKMGDLWRGDEVVKTSIKDVEVLSRGVFLRSNEWAFPFLKYDPAAEAFAAIADAFEGNMEFAEKREKILAYLTSRFLDSKSCESQISFSADINAEISLDVSGFISPVTAKLGLTGDLSGKTEYAEGEEFEVDRAARSGIIYEIKTDRTRANCASEPSAVRIFVSGSDGLKGELTAGEIEAAGFNSGRSGFPLYTCRQEFVALREILTNKYGLPTPIATFVIAYMGEYRQTDNASKCAQSKLAVGAGPAQ